MSYKEDIQRRRLLLIKLQRVLKKHEASVISALYDDFKKPQLESILTETNIVYSELKLTLNSIHRWTKPKRVWSNLLNFPSSDWIYQEPYGNVLIIAPWNYPFQLTFCPLIGAIAAGNKVTLKPSELAPKTAEIICKIIAEVSQNNEIEVVLGDKNVAQDLLERKWDYIFFTGSNKVGKLIAQVAAKNLTPVTLELGGKNPCIVDQTAHIQLAAKRIIWGKLMNAGQTCIAPDYVLVHNSIKEQLVDHLIKEIEKALGKNQQESHDFARIVSRYHWERLLNLVNDQKILFGGKTNEADLFISPTLLDEPSLESALMQEEIFGPILPILSYQSESDIKAIVSKYEKPLSLYVFSTNKKFVDKIIHTYAFGGGCVNDTVVYFANKNLPFGGIGASGMGVYHGKYSFTTFSHAKPILKKANWLDIPLRYAPYKNKINILKKLLHWL
jgi:aldehyde dehydrogenase (NAD+)